MLARVVRRLGTRELVTAQEIEGLFAADLAYLQDFYGVINFGTPADIDALLQAQEELERETSKSASSSGNPASPRPGKVPGRAKYRPRAKPRTGRSAPRRFATSGRAGTAR